MLIDRVREIQIVSQFMSLLKANVDPNKKCLKIYDSPCPQDLQAIGQLRLFILYELCLLEMPTGIAMRRYLVYLSDGKFKFFSENMAQPIKQ